MQKQKLGFIINPVAGIGGRVGLKGSDGSEILKKALALGALPESPLRAGQALERVLPLRDRLEIVTWPGAMGEEVAASCGFSVRVLSAEHKTQTTPQDTESAASCLAEHGVDLILFAGGDGTARNIYHAVADTLPVLGIPAGVKIHSAVYATCPRNAGDLALQFLRNKKAHRLRDAEVMDIDEDAFRGDQVRAKLYGYLKVPYVRHLIQKAKAGSRLSDEQSIDEIASDVIMNMADRDLYLIGSGTTTRSIMTLLDLPNTLLGVDAVLHKKLIGSDVNEEQMLKLLEGQPGKIVVTAIGGQGHIFGRGNQQISPRVIRKIGKENIKVIATQDKIVALQGQPLLVDTGDPEVNQMLSGYVRVTTGYGKELVYPVAG